MGILAAVSIYLIPEMPHGIFFPLGQGRIGLDNYYLSGYSEDSIYSSNVRKALFSSTNGSNKFGRSSLYRVASGIDDLAVLCITEKTAPPGVLGLLSLYDERSKSYQKMKENELESDDYHLDRNPRNLIINCNSKHSVFKSMGLDIRLWVCSDMIYRSQLGIIDTNNFPSSQAI